MSKKKIGIIILTVIVIIAAVAGFFVLSNTGVKKVNEMSVEQAQEFVNKEFDKMAQTDAAKMIAEKNEITVNSVEYGNERDIILNCTVDTIDVYSAIMPEINNFLGASPYKKNTKMAKSATNFMVEFNGQLKELIGKAEPIRKECTLYIYDTDFGHVLYTPDNHTDIVYGNLISLCNKVNSIKTYRTQDEETGEYVEKEIESPNINKGFGQCFELIRTSEKPDTSNVFGRFVNKFKQDFNKNFVEHDNYKLIVNGLWITIRLTVYALLIGILIGFIVAFIRCTYLKKTKRSILLKFFNLICQTYLTVIRGTPVVVQIMIMYFVIFMPMGVDKFLAAVICFGLNSGAYVAEIVRGGIMSIDDGQTEAGRSLGLNYMQTMYHIIFPQAFKAVLPALANELVVLLKETSIAFYIGLGDLMYAGNAIRAATYSAFMPLIAVAIIYLAMVLLLSKLVSILERRLRTNER